MNIAGHAFVASKVIGRMNGKVALGADLPDLVPFIPGSVFTFEQIHEGGNVFYKFLEKNNKLYLDVARAMMSHSVKWGADKFNKDVDGWLLGNKGNSYWKSRIMEASDVDEETAGHRLHNYLWAGVDVWVLKNKREFVRKWMKARGEMKENVAADLLAKCFGKDVALVKQNLVDLERSWGHSKWTIEDWVDGWVKFVSGLPEGDSVDRRLTVALVKDVYGAFEKRWEDIVNGVVIDVRERMNSYL